MFGIPSRHAMDALAQALSPVVPPVMLGIAQWQDETRVSVGYAHAGAFGAQIVAAADVLPVFVPPANGVRVTTADDLEAHRARPIEGHLLTMGIRRVVTVPLAADPPALLWIGSAGTEALPARQEHALVEIVARHQALVSAREPDGEAAERWRRMEVAAELLTALQQVLDVREVFDRVFEVSRKVLPHDIMALGLFNDDLSEVTLHAQSGMDVEVPPAVRNPYPAAATLAFDCHVMHDSTLLPLAGDINWAERGIRSSLRVPVKSTDRLEGVLNFASTRPGTFSPADVVVARRIADYVALAMSHHRMAEQSRQTARLRERTANLEMLDGLLTTLTGVLDIREVFDRVSEIARKVLPHDAMGLPVLTDDREHVIPFATSGVPGGTLPSIQPILDSVRPLLTQPWDFHNVPDLSTNADLRDTPFVRLGHRSLLRLPIRIDGVLVGMLVFFSRQRAAYSDDDALIGRRIADHVAMAISHQRLADESRRAEALRERAANLQMLDGMLDTLSGVLDVREVFARVSDIAQRALPHDGMSITNLEGETVRIFAAKGLGDQPGPLEMPIPDPTVLTEQWEYQIIEELAASRFVSARAGQNAGMRSVLIVPIRRQGRLQGSVNFFSRSAGRFTRDDVIVARRVADQIALALSHHRLAEEVRRSESLKAREANLELLDHLLQNVADTGGLREAFDAVAALARKVIAHDAMVLPVLLADGVRVRFYAATAPGTPPFPEVSDVPEVLRRSDWEFELADDMPMDPVQRDYPAATLGYRSALRLPIRFDGQTAAGLAFFSRTPAFYTQADVLVGRRIADRLALTLVREQGLAASKRADEAAERASRLEARVRELTNELDARTGYRRVVGSSPQWTQVLTQATQVAGTATTALLLGESGTGKEVVARFLHRASARSSGPFIALNCAALPEQLLEAELFGFERGAFTGATQSKPGQLEQASGGTLFLDEVGEMSPSAQAKFLRVLQEREFQRLGGTRVLRTDARIIAATNRDLQKAIAQGQFREDLYYRLNVFAIQLPPLRDRRDDVLPLSEAFLAEIARGLGRPPAGISRDARVRLLEYPWPGNVRELRNVLERAAILCDGGLITAEHLALDVRLPRHMAPPAAAATSAATAAVLPGAVATAAGPARPTSAGDLQDMERAMIEQALQDARFNKSKAAKVLGLTRQQLYVRMRRYGLE